MKSRWSDLELAALVSVERSRGVGTLLAERVYTSRLLGGDPRLTLHGGGNTSLKTGAANVFGEEEDVMHIKGSGWDLGTIEAAGLPAVRLAPLRRLRALPALDDETMVNLLRGNLLDSQAPTPSVETLLHAFLPHAFIDHTHALPILSLVDQPDGDRLVRQVFGTRLGVVPYVMPGFALAKAAVDVFDQNPVVEGLILLRHGLFTFGETARQSYERTVEFVTLAEEAIGRGGQRATGEPAVRGGSDPMPRPEIAPALRGALSRAAGGSQQWILDGRASPVVREALVHPDLARLAAAGPATPDHVIRTKSRLLILPAPAKGTPPGEFAVEAQRAAERYAADYGDYFSRHNARCGGGKRSLDAVPRVVLMPGVGLFGVGATAREAAVVADVAESWAETVLGAERVGRFEPINEAEQFDMEYWSLEQAKLGRASRPPLAGQIVLVTGGAGTIGQAVGRAFAALGAEVVLTDLDKERVGLAARAVGGRTLGVPGDVTDAASVRAVFDRACEVFGGVDIVVSNAGAAWTGPIATLPEETLRRSFELNFFAHQLVAQNAVRVLRAQGTGGALLFNVSKQAINPGPDFGAYGIPKAATLSLSRQYALEHGRDGIRVNAVNADRIRSGLLTGEMIAARSKARGLSEQDYMAGNLLQREVTADDVAQAFVHHALALKTTGDVTTVDGGNIAAVLR